MIRRPTHSRAGLTLTEVLISIMLLGIGMVSLATLFPLGLLRLRTAQRMSRSAYLFESAAADLGTRNLLHKISFTNPTLAPWYNAPAFTPTPYDPWVQDTISYGGAAYNANGPLGAVRPVGVGLPVAYDPLWRWQTGIYLNPGVSLEARFGNGQGFVTLDTDNTVAADGLQRLTNFNPALAPSNIAFTPPDIFVSPEDYLWSNGEGQQGSTNVSPVVPDMAPSVVTLPNNSLVFNSDFSGTVTTHDWRYSWMFTGQQSDANNGTVFEGDIVVFENRQFGIQSVTGPIGQISTYQVTGETVVEGVFGYSLNVFPNPGYSRAADNVVLLRWPATMPDPQVRVGEWIADVTYTRSFTGDMNRRLAGITAQQQALTTQGVPPAQRCYWYQIQKRSDPTADTAMAGFRSMTVWTTTPVRAKTLLTAGTGIPVYRNAALICPSVVNVLSKTIYAR
jgi:hypothetical protein